MNYVVIAGCAYYMSGGLPIDDTWRFALAFGAVPSALTLYFRVLLHESKVFLAIQAEDNPDVDVAAVDANLVAKSKSGHSKLATTNWRLTLAILWEYKWTLVGTAGNWFLLDVTVRGRASARVP